MRDEVGVSIGLSPRSESNYHSFKRMVKFWQHSFLYSGQQTHVDHYSKLQWDLATMP